MTRSTFCILTALLRFATTFQHRSTMIKRAGFLISFSRTVIVIEGVVRKKCTGLISAFDVV